ncbi:LysM peptidoglycan-binding domain-containing protein, partial [Virgibacillus sp. W0430]|uniref:LysM peptidoglycan-binding domain-containing protein n=1 Tax=Virgibacillus sp. W0430 TaxID=3391580 RepID=UPI003F47F596
MEVRVRAHDTLWSYSQLFGIPLSLIISSNPQINPNQLQVGDSVQIPGYQLIEYTINTNDSLWAIARNYSLPLHALLVVNQAVNPLQLQ